MTRRARTQARPGPSAAVPWLPHRAPIVSGSARPAPSAADDGGSVTTRASTGGPEDADTRGATRVSTGDATGASATSSAPTFARAPSDRAAWVSLPPPEDDSEERLLDRLVRRDERAFHALVKEYEARVFRLVLRMLGDRAEAEDVAQEVFVQVFKAIGSFRRDAKLSTWIYRIAINLCKNRSKYLKVRHAGDQQDFDALHEGVGPAPEKGATVSHIPRPDDALAGSQLERIVQKAILELEPSFRECLVLRDVEDLSYDEIEAITGLAEGTVKSRIHRARMQLKQFVERDLGEKLP